jgi:hypothetical protein
MDSFTLIDLTAKQTKHTKKFIKVMPREEHEGSKG